MINSIVGLMNSGKTLYMTYKLFLAYCNGKNIITNYNLNFPHYKINEDWLKELAKNQDQVLENVAMGFDEIWLWMDSRASQRNRISTYFFLQSSKDDTEIYMTAQHNGQLDVRLRQNMHKISQCSRVLKINGKYHDLDEEQRFLPEKYQKLLYIKVVDFKRVNIGGYTEMMPAATYYIKADLIFRLYDTRQKIKGKK